MEFSSNSCYFNDHHFNVIKSNNIWLAESRINIYVHVCVPINIFMYHTVGKIIKLFKILDFWQRIFLVTEHCEVSLFALYWSFKTSLSILLFFSQKHRFRGEGVYFLYRNELPPTDHHNRQVRLHLLPRNNIRSLLVDMTLIIKQQKFSLYKWKIVFQETLGAVFSPQNVLNFDMGPALSPFSAKSEMSGCPFAIETVCVWGGGGW